MTDQDGNVYKTIVIGTQEWMAENLKASHYRNGDAIPLVTSDSIWAGLSTGATCWYNNDSVNYNCPYGKFYNGYAVADPRNICPAGWHIPSDSEWILIGFFLGEDSIAGGKMKSTATNYWYNPNSAADNTSGFSGLPGGWRYENGTYAFLTADGIWWGFSQGTFVSRHLVYSNGTLYRIYNGVRFGFSVRCLRD